ncbi:MAG TPA: adenine phosphoribosyltransferase [Ohtaekwangia sp.]|nr:adenine phosphoribosyltransferase [Ohtaekwangia sp.]
MLLTDKIKGAIRDVKDYPSPGIVFKDITPVLSDAPLMREITACLVDALAPLKVDAIAAVEARGFIFGSILAHALNCPFIPVRKAGKLPFKTRSQNYELEYGKASVEIHTDAIKSGWRVLVHDDLLATGGTAGAAAELIKSFDAELAGFSFLVNLSFLPGESNLIKRFGVKPQYLVSY